MYILSLFILIVSSEIYVKAECPPIVLKNEWGGANPRYVQYLTPPTDLVIIQHTVNETCSNDKDCIDTVRNIQKIHIEESMLADIGPSFLIGGNGKVYEGRGWNRIAIHTYGYNEQSIGIAFIGNFNNQDPTRGALEAARALIQCGIENNRLTTNHSVVVHKQLIPTESPGNNLVSKIMSWPDWVQDVTEIKKRAVTLENLRETKNIALTTTTAPMTTTTSKSTTETQVVIEDRFLVLTTPKQIDLLTSIRDVIIELINNLRNLALQLLKTVDSLARSVMEGIRRVLNRILSVFIKRKDEINATISIVAKSTILPSTSECIRSLNKEGDEKFDKIEQNIRGCADKKAKELDDMIKSLGELGNNALVTSTTAAENTRNCTELNFGVKKPTEDCLNSVTRNTRNAIADFQKQKTLALTAIQTALDSLTSTIERCSERHLLEANTNSVQLSSSLTRCTNFIENSPKLKIPNPFGFEI